MAQKRMFDKRVVDSDKFADLPNSSKALYFMAGMQADDRGFFQPRKLQREFGFSDDDFKILIAKSYFILFESGVMVVTDWNKNNWLDNRRITETEYVEELKLLKLVNSKYELENNCLADAKPMLSQYSIEENSIDNTNNNILSGKKSDNEKTVMNKPTFSEEISKIINYLNDVLGTRYTTKSKATNTLIKARLEEGHTVDDFRTVIDNKHNEWGNDPKMVKYLRPETLFRASHFESYLNEVENHMTKAKKEERNINAEQRQEYRDYNEQLKKLLDGV